MGAVSSVPMAAQQVQWREGEINGGGIGGTLAEPQAPPFIAPNQSQQVDSTIQGPTVPSMGQLASGAIRGAMTETAQAGGYSPVDVQAGQVATEDLTAYTNPYTQQVVDRTVGDMTRAHQQQQMLANQQMGQAGAFGGSRHGIYQAELDRGFYDRLGATTGALHQQGFQQAQQLAGADVDRRYQADVGNRQAQAAAAQNRLASANQLAQIGNLGFDMGQTVNRNLAQQGTLQQALQQQLIDAAKAQYAGYAGAPAASIGYLSDALGASPIPMSSQSRNDLGAMDYLQLGAQLYGAFSDARLKENIARVGELPNGLGLYTWDWTEDAKDKGFANSMSLGVIAQEVQETHPEYVEETPSGYLAVDYSAVYKDI